MTRYMIKIYKSRKILQFAFCRKMNLVNHISSYSFSGEGNPPDNNSKGFT